MVKVDTNATVDDKKEATAKKKISSKKKESSHMWPCKINGCTKQFAREADLKRHQRTTKLHSVPSFSCPQCDATFTRPDALRRHQKAGRHKGLVIESTVNSENEESEEDAAKSGTPSSSRDGTSSSKGPDPIASVQIHQGASTSTGPPSHYRPHTMSISSYVYPRQAYPPVPLPEGATRLHPTHTWAYPWPGGPIGAFVPAYPIPGPPGVYQPSPYYRQPSVGKNDAQSGGSVSPLSMSSQSSFSMASDEAVLPITVSSMEQNSADAPEAVIEKDGSTVDSERVLTEEQLTTLKTFIETAKAALHESRSSSPISGVKRDRADDGTVNPISLHSTASTSAVSRLSSAEPMEMFHDSPLHPRSPKISPYTHLLSPLPSHSTLDEVDNGPLDPLKPSLDDPYASKPLERPEPMEHLLTEDGEPMLNPAELLTQESLASPPPS